MAKSERGIQPFLKWAGGKRWLAERLERQFAALEGRYFEPFLGSGAVFLRYQPSSAVLSDTNAELIECYRALRDAPADVAKCLRRLAKLDPNESYYQVRSSTPKSAPAKAARFLYLNRTCWNGLYRVNLKGQFNVPRGTKTQIILPDEDFEIVSAALRFADIRHSDFEAVVDEAAAGDLVFADPPYTVAHNMNGFVKYNQRIFSWDDQVRLRDALLRAAKRGCSIVLSNADHESVRTLYEGFGSVEAVTRASVIAGNSSARKPTTELLVVQNG